MSTLNKPLLAMTATDLMGRHLVLVPQEMSLRAAAHLLSQNQVSGAAVVDGNGCCIGVLSATDFVHWTEDEARAAKTRTAPAPPVCSWQVLEELDDLPSDRGSAHMTADPVTVPPGTPIVQPARTMLDAHIHRVIVVDERRRPVGVVSSTDILAAVARADASGEGKGMPTSRRQRLPHPSWYVNPSTSNRRGML